LDAGVPWNISGLRTFLIFLHQAFLSKESLESTGIIIRRKREGCHPMRAMKSARQHPGISGIACAIPSL
jgi:hypothetical protein